MVELGNWLVTNPSSSLSNSMRTLSAALHSRKPSTECSAAREEIIDIFNEMKGGGRRRADGGGKSFHFYDESRVFRQSVAGIGHRTTKL